MIRSLKAINTFSGGIDQDTAVTKVDNTHYFDAENMRIVSNDASSSGALTNVKGNVLRLTFASGDVILGFCKIRNNYNHTDKDSIIFFTYNPSAPTSRIYRLEGDPHTIAGNVNMDQAFGIISNYKAGYIYRDSNLGFNELYPIKAEGRYESANIRKVYWVDGHNPMRYMIIDTVVDDGISTKFDINPVAELTTPTSTVMTGGLYKSGMVQHAYQLYIKNGAASTYSPTSSIQYLSAHDQASDSINFNGSELDKNTGKAVQVSITGLSNKYNRIRVVAIHYTELFSNPIVRVIAELEYSGANVLVIDNGYTSYGTVPLDEFRLFGQTNYTANSITSKNNYLLLGNVIEDKWNPTWLSPTGGSWWDSRAVRFRTTAVLSATASCDAITFDQDDGFTMVKDSPSILRITIADLSSIITVPAGRTITGINSITSTALLTAVSGLYHDGADNPIAFESLQAATTFTLTSFTQGTNQTILTATKTDGNYFGGDFNHLVSCILYYMVFNYTYTYTATYNNALVSDHDVSPGDVTITAPAFDTVNDWNVAGWSNYVYSHDGINKYNNTDNDLTDQYGCRFCKDLSTLGAEGPNIKVTFTTEDLYVDKSAITAVSHNSFVTAPYTNTALSTNHRSSQRREVYRMFIQFFNKRMQTTSPQWIADIRMPSNDEINMINNEAGTNYRMARYIYPKVSIKNLPPDNDIYGWQILRSERGSTDRSVMATGLVSAMEKSNTISYTNVVRPRSTKASPYMFIAADDVATPSVKSILEFISPEILFNKNLSFVSGDKLRVEGRYEINKSKIDVVSTNAQSTMILGKTKARHANDAKYQTITDAFIHPLGITTGDTSMPTPLTINAESYRHAAYYQDTGTDYYGNRGTSLVVSLGSDISVSTAQTGLIFASYIRNVFDTQYGGNTYEARSFSNAIPYSEFILSATNPKEIVCYKGDTHITMFAYLRSGIADVPAKPGIQEMVFIPCESSINCHYRLDPLQKYYNPMTVVTKLQEKLSQGIVLQPDTYPIELGDLYKYNSVYSASDRAKFYQCEIFDSNNIEANDVKILSAGPKINNEYFDSWTNIYTNNSLELDSKYGAIHNLITLNGSVFAFQDKAVSTIAVNERSTIQDNNKLQLTLGTGGVLERYDYLSTYSGIQNYYDVVAGESTFYYVDRRNKVINTFTQEGPTPISELMGYRSFLKTFGNITNVRTGYDPVYKDVYFYITDGSITKTSVFNEHTKSFISTQSFVPSIMFNLNDRFYSTKDNTCYQHDLGNYGVFYGAAPAASNITLIINPTGVAVNKYDTLDIRMDVISGTAFEQFDTITITNTYQTVSNKSLTFTGDDSTLDTYRGIINKFRIPLLPTSDLADSFRFVDTYVKVKLSRVNTSNKKFILHDITTYYRPTKN